MINQENEYRAVATEMGTDGQPTRLSVADGAGWLDGTYVRDQAASEMEVEAAARAMNPAPWDASWLTTTYEERERAKERARKYARAALTAAAGAVDLDEQAARENVWLPAQPVVETADTWSCEECDYTTTRPLLIAAHCHDANHNLPAPGTASEALLHRMDPDGWQTEDGDWLIDIESEQFQIDVRALLALARRSQPAPRTVTEWGRISRTDFANGRPPLPPPSPDEYEKWRARGYLIVRREVTEWVEVQP